MPRVLLLIVVVIAGCWDGRLKTAYPSHQGVMDDLDFAARQVGCETEFKERSETEKDWRRENFNIMAFVEGGENLELKPGNRLQITCEGNLFFLDTCCTKVGGYFKNVAVYCGVTTQKTACEQWSRKIIDEARAN